MAEWKTLTVPLTHPIEGVNELRFQEPSAAALEEMADGGASGNEVRAAIAMIAAMMVDEEHKPIVRKLHRDDFRKITEALTPFVQG